MDALTAGEPNTKPTGRGPLGRARLALGAQHGAAPRARQPKVTHLTAKRGWGGGWLGVKDGVRMQWSTADLMQADAEPAPGSLGGCQLLVDPMVISTGLGGPRRGPP